VAHQLETRMTEQVLDIAARAGEEIVDAEHFIAVGEQAVARMRAEKAGPAGHQHPFGKVLSHRHSP
jgi:hypothetical protein